MFQYGHNFIRAFGSCCIVRKCRKGFSSSDLLIGIISAIWGVLVFADQYLRVERCFIKDIHIITHKNCSTSVASTKAYCLVWVLYKHVLWTIVEMKSSVIKKLNSLYGSSNSKISSERFCSPKYGFSWGRLILEKNNHVFGEKPNNSQRYVIWIISILQLQSNLIIIRSVRNPYI